MTKAKYIADHQLKPVIDEILTVAREVCGPIQSHTFLRDRLGDGVDLIIAVRVNGKHDPEKHTAFALKTAHLCNYEHLIRWYLQFTRAL